LLNEVEKLIDEKLKTEEKHYRKQNKILKELINKKDELHENYVNQIKDFKKEINSLESKVENSIVFSEIVMEKCDKSISRYSTIYLFIIGFGLLSLSLYGLKH